MERIKPVITWLNKYKGQIIISIAVVTLLTWAAYLRFIQKRPWANWYSLWDDLGPIIGVLVGLFAGELLTWFREGRHAISYRKLLVHEIDQNLNLVNTILAELNQREKFLRDVTFPIKSEENDNDKKSREEQIGNDLAGHLFKLSFPELPHNVWDTKFELGTRALDEAEIDRVYNFYLDLDRLVVN